ncbi:intercellular adhesion molecule 2 isoform X1 [Sturnira hondurensis]|uniref:intercellular adhesion molecule 2 isoform X1 n=1 Tax=Sturnira hondurensis TaxID=192404 RepID=UPI00187A827D|nr:intercellular adhesion molecule 2 isoform X1 [Sturnira hondurensis]XP_036925631.1 intercellular adhesion molecule 2 isoform X1 [Sturnira hondurensis]XP_036925632.1 intercellular adhesion molecule 2 isoform X1 [Sturnira hondurensis]XP_036925634.1 intercellular adhesion molecule 2 isoform X1 [Sturnira hondurensis]XP_036925635.1 intercellular adhesion molecule 2 isoform X1 [Sturnira hondurensis]XP_036925636.1 intercellular adhesion molecule 2 isoform X1 [Sturnira hondurensis]XP_036925637.1 in
MSPSGCWGLPVALLALLFCPGSAEEFEVRTCTEQLVVEHGGSTVINCSTTCPTPDTGGVETSLNKTLLKEGAQWKQYKVFGISQDTAVLCYFTCSQKQVSAPVNISVFYPPKVVLMTVQPIWVIMGESFIIECRVPDVAPLEKLTLTLLRGNESLHRQTFEGATATPQEAMTTYNRTAHREDEHYNFSCQAELDLQSRGGKIIRTTSESQGLKIHEPKQSKQMLIVIVAVSVLLLLFVTSVLLCFIFGQQWHQRRRGSYGVQAAWRRLRRAYRA